MNARLLIQRDLILRHSRRIAAGLLVLLGMAGLAQAQSNECNALGLSFQKRQATIEQIQSFNKKPPTPDLACASFSRLVAQTNELIKAIEDNGAWCHVPQEVLPGLQSQAPQIAEGRKNSCAAAEQQRKAKAAPPSTNPFSGGDSVVGGAVKMPKGAL